MTIIHKDHIAVGEIKMYINEGLKNVLNIIKKYGKPSSLLYMQKNIIL